MGHGICYIPALSYINIRSKSEKDRIVNLTVPHVLYVTGIGVACLVNFQFVYHLPISIMYPKPFDLNALLVAILSFLIFVGVGVNEWAQMKSSYNYKFSLDPNIQREIENKTLFDRKYFPITNDPHQSVPITNATITRSTRRETGLTVFAYFSRIQSLIYLYAPFHYFNHIMTVILYSPLLVFIPTIFAILGICISATLLLVFNYKMHFLVIWINQLSAMLFWILNLVLAPLLNAWIVVPTWITFAFLSMSRPAADIHILTYTRIKHSELHMGFSYALEFLILGLMQYYSLLYPTSIFGSGSTYFSFLAGHVIAFYIAILLVGIYGLAVMPSKKFFGSKTFVSLLEIKNWINNERPVSNIMPANLQHPSIGYQQAEQYPLMNVNLMSGGQSQQGFGNYAQARQATFVPVGS